MSRGQGGANLALAPSGAEAVEVLDSTQGPAATAPDRGNLSPNTHQATPIPGRA